MIRRKYILLVVALLLGLFPWALAQNTGKTGHLTLAARTQIGNVILEPGNYDVTHHFSATGHFAEFTKVTEWNLGYEGTPTYQERKVVAKAYCTSQPLNATVGKTKVWTESSRIVRLEIKGENVAHTFDMGF